MEFETLLEKYLQNTLTKEEELTFNEILKTDSEKKTEVEFQLNLKKVATHVDEEDFRNLVSEIEHTVKRRQVHRTSYIKWLMAASIILLMGVGYFYATTVTKVSNTELFASYFEPYRNVVHPIVRSSEQQDAQSMAFMAYEGGDYEKAIRLLNQLYVSTQEPYYLFYSANALLQLNRAEEAIPLLLKHLTTKKTTLTERTHWYLALAYINIDDAKKAKEELEIVIDHRKYKTKEAEKLLNEIK